MASYNEYANDGFIVTIIYRIDDEEFALVDGSGLGDISNNNVPNTSIIKTNEPYVCETIYTPATIDTSVFDLITKIIVTKDDKKIQKNE